MLLPEAQAMVLQSPGITLKTQLTLPVTEGKEAGNLFMTQINQMLRCPITGFLIVQGNIGGGKVRIAGIDKYNGDASLGYGLILFKIDAGKAAFRGFYDQTVQMSVQHQVKGPRLPLQLVFRGGQKSDIAGRIQNLLKTFDNGWKDVGIQMGGNDADYPGNRLVCRRLETGVGKHLRYIGAASLDTHNVAQFLQFLQCPSYGLPGEAEDFPQLILREKLFAGLEGTQGNLFLGPAYNIHILQRLLHLVFLSPSFIYFCSLYSV
jgi:hypothetical protein